MNTCIWAITIMAASMALPTSAAASQVAPVDGAQSFAGAGVSGPSSSASKVRLNAGFADAATKDGTRVLVVHLRMVRGWHVNAHPASEKFLIATQLSARAGDTAVALKTDYPPGVDSGVKLGGTAIKVYDDDTSIHATLPAATVAVVSAAGDMTVTVQVQACSDKGVCLPPSRLHQRLKW